MELLNAQNKTNTLVTIIVPAYRSGYALYEAIASILKQTYRPLQLIICDDGTEHFSQETVQQQVNAEARRVECIVLHHSENIGTVKNLCSGLEKASGKWILFLAADDCLADETVIESLLRQTEEEKAEWIIPKTMLLEGKTKTIVPDDEVSKILISANQKRLYEKLCFQCCLPASGSLYKKELLEKMGGFDSRFCLVEDWPLFLKLLRNGHMPKESRNLVTLHADGGVSRKKACKNLSYQTDLINIMTDIILPEWVDRTDETQQKLQRWIQDKEAIFQLRFQCQTIWQKLVWFVTHADVVLRKVLYKGGNHV